MSDFHLQRSRARRSLRYWALFGPEYARGAFRTRLHFQERGKIYITIGAQSDFEEFGGRSVSSEATLYLRSEPALLDNFIGELKALTAGKREDATLEAQRLQQTLYCKVVT